jgi:hypothetical protein
VIKQYQDERRKNHVSIHIFSDNSVADDFPDTNNVGIIDHTALREWVDTMIEPLYTKGSNLKLVVEPINASYKNVNRDERLRRAATDLICAEKDLHTSRELFERDGVELLRLKTETQRKIDEYQRACTHGATSQFCYLYKHTIPLEQYKCSVLRLRDALIPAVTKILIFLIDADEDRLKLYARTLENALAWLTPLEQT